MATEASRRRIEGRVVTAAAAASTRIPLIATGQSAARHRAAGPGGRRVPGLPPAIADNSFLLEEGCSSI